MHKFWRSIGISLLAVGIAVLLFVLFLKLISTPEILSPVPQEAPVQGEPLSS